MLINVVHIMWGDYETWCGIPDMKSFNCMASKTNPVTCKECLKSPFAGEYFTSKELEDRYNDLFDKYVDRFNVVRNEMTRKIAIMLLEQARRQT